MGSELDRALFDKSAITGGRCRPGEGISITQSIPTYDD